MRCLGLAFCSTGLKRSSSRLCAMVVSESTFWCTGPDKVTSRMLSRTSSNCVHTVLSDDFGHLILFPWRMDWGCRRGAWWVWSLVLGQLECGEIFSTVGCFLAGVLLRLIGHLGCWCSTPAWTDLVYFEPFGVFADFSAAASDHKLADACVSIPLNLSPPHHLSQDSLRRLWGIAHLVPS